MSKQPMFDRDTGSAYTIDVPHAKIHEGLSFMSACVFRTVNDAGYALALVKSGTKYEIHMDITCDSGGLALLDIFSGAVASTEGTAISEFPRNQEKLNGTYTSGVSLFANPTLSNSGTLRYTCIINGGGKGVAFGGQQESRAEIILAEDTTYLFRVQNISSGVKAIGIEFDWYGVAE